MDPAMLEDTAMNWLSNLVRKMFPERSRHNILIVTKETGFSVQQGPSKSVEVNWDDVNEIAAFKRDLFTVDMICLAIGCCDFAIEVNEEMAGWQDFVQKLPDNLPGCKSFPEWFLEVAFPAFETNTTVIFKRNPHLRVPGDSKDGNRV